MSWNNSGYIWDSGNSQGLPQLRRAARLRFQGLASPSFVEIAAFLKRPLQNATFTHKLSKAAASLSKNVGNVMSGMISFTFAPH